MRLHEWIERIREGLMVVAAFAACATFAGGVEAGLVAGIIVAAVIVWQTRPQLRRVDSSPNFFAHAPLEQRGRSS